MPFSKYSAKQKKLARIAVPRDKITAADLGYYVATKRKGNKICPAGIAWARRTFDKYPSAYANMAASKYCKDPNYAKKSKKKK